ncbi:MAG: hypothetical protein JNK47_18085 [Mesorhizobium sp.]|nr:hypothetical protein [Mesorhizobium sp.]MBL8579133.1 hypothetical protein [Mesorhizobium sp.]
MTDDLKQALERFLTGEDTTILAANHLEALLDAAYPDDEFIQEAVVALAQYRPDGGQFLYDTPELQRQLTKVRDYLRRNLGLSNI